ncbi:hypothetical protein MG293_009965 [Ovis ammon polii]|uniref:Uncharacterized protein n=1 Tax=Ovis ammon polii TaxID=230172 RepID=A0AAD4U9J1_OVIAM|nr:hypothetical protein MG293_009965 [Ovis ammon polii]
MSEEKPQEGVKMEKDHINLKNSGVELQLKFASHRCAPVVFECCYNFLYISVTSLQNFVVCQFANEMIGLA